MPAGTKVQEADTELELSLVSHHHAAAPAHQAAPTLPAPCCTSTLRVLYSIINLPTRLARFTLCHPRPKSLSRGFVIRAIGEAAPPSCRTPRLIKPSDKPAVVRARHHRHSLHHAAGLIEALQEGIYKVRALRRRSMLYQSLPGLEPAGHASPHDCTTQEAALGRIALHAPPPNLLLSHADGGPNRDDFTAHNTRPRQAQLRGDSSRCIRCSHW